MSQHPLNLAVRFALELAALAALGRWSWMAQSGALRWLLVLGIPVIAATAWGLLRVPNEPHHHAKHGVIAVRGPVRLLVEAALFGGAVAALAASGATGWAWGMAAVTLAHYLVSWDRVVWLLRH